MDPHPVQDLRHLAVVSVHNVYTVITCRLQPLPGCLYRGVIPIYSN